MKNVQMALFVLVAVLLIALAETGRTAVNRHYDYQEMTAAKSLHQLSPETRSGGDNRRSGALLGAGIFAVGLVGFAVLTFAGMSGREFGRGLGRRKRRASRPAAQSQVGPRILPPETPAMQSLPRSPVLPSLPLMEASHDEDPR